MPRMGWQVATNGSTPSARGGPVAGHNSRWRAAIEQAPSGPVQPPALRNCAEVWIGPLYSGELSESSPADSLGTKSWQHC